MRRREFIAALMLASTMRVAVAQQPAKMKHIAIMSAATKVGDMSVSRHRLYRAFFEELSRLGYVEGQNLSVERYSGEGRPERYAELVARFSQIEGYKCLSLTRALDVVECQLALV